MVTNMVTRPARPKAPPEVISAAEFFKAKCLELMDAVATMGALILATKRGRLSPVPAARALADQPWSGSPR